WVTGVLLLLLVFYHGHLAAETFTTGTWIMLVVTFLAVFLYDAIMKSPLAANINNGYTVLFVIGSIIVIAFVFVGGMSARGTLIHTGAMFGTIMAFNVWFRIWPAQQVIIRALKDGTAADPELAKMAGLRSRHNTYLSVPLVFAMINSHVTWFYGGN